MKKTIYAALLVLLFSCSTKVVDFDQLQDRNGLYFLVNDEKPFTGEVASYISGKLEFEGAVKNGLKDGPWNYYYPSGQKKIAGIYTDGLKEGTWTYWKENGTQESIEIYKLGQRLGNEGSPAGEAAKTDSTPPAAAPEPPSAKPAETKTNASKQGATQQKQTKTEPKKPEPVVWERLRGAAVKSLDGIPYTGPVVKYFREGGKELDGEFQYGHRHGKWVFYDRYGNIKDVRYY